LDEPEPISATPAPEVPVDSLKREAHSYHHPGMRMRLCPTYRLPSSSKSKPVLVVVNKSRPPMPLLWKIQ
jgi:hypothetical protein